MCRVLGSGCAGLVLEISRAPDLALTLPSLPGEFSIPEQGSYDVIELPYQGETLSLLIATPFQPNAPLSALAAAIDTQLMAEWKGNMSAVTRLLVLPK